MTAPSNTGKAPTIHSYPPAINAALAGTKHTALMSTAAT